MDEHSLVPPDSEESRSVGTMPRTRVYLPQGLGATSQKVGADMQKESDLGHTSLLQFVSRSNATSGIKSCIGIGSMLVPVQPSGQKSRHIEMALWTRQKAMLFTTTPKRCGNAFTGSASTGHLLPLLFARRIAPGATRTKKKSRPSSDTKPGSSSCRIPLPHHKSSWHQRLQITHQRTSGWHSGVRSRGKLFQGGHLLWLHGGSAKKNASNSHAKFGFNQQKKEPRQTPGGTTRRFTSQNRKRTRLYRTISDQSI